jgi:SSS family solute:Na+ symporter/sodium/proline symporter
MIYGAVVIATVVALLAISVGRTVKLRTHADFMVAGRQLSPAVLIFTLLCAWIGAGSLFGGAEFAYREGLASLWLPAGGWAGLIVVYFIAGRARAFARYTVPDLLETRYGPLARTFGTLCIIVSFTAIVSYQFRGGGRILNLAFGIEERAGTVIVAVFVIIFTALAGMSSVAYTDLLIGVMVTLGALVIFPMALAGAGGWNGVHAALPASHFTLLGGMTWLEAFGYFLPTFTLMVGNQSSYQKFVSARTERDARISVLGWIVGTLFLETVIVLLAMIGGIMARGEIESGALPAWGIIPYLSRHGVIPIVGAVFLASVFAQVVSTGNNYLFSPATNVVHDVLRHVFFPNATDATLVRVSRLVVVLLGLLALAQSFQESILAMAVYAYNVYGVGITPVVVAAFFWKRATTAGGISSIAAGTAVAVIWKVFSLDPLVPMIFPALGASLAGLIAVSLLTPPPREEQWRPFFR